MILYLDASALVKEYLVDEAGASDVAAVRRDAELVGTSAISRAETAAALAKAVGTQTLSYSDAWAALRSFRSDWPDLARIHVSDAVVERADSLAWKKASADSTPFILRRPWPGETVWEGTLSLRPMTSISGGPPCDFVLRRFLTICPHSLPVGSSTV